MALTPSQRITLIKVIAERLANEDYPLIDVTLRQFSLPVSDQWSGPKGAYVLKMIETAIDQSLMDLAQHVGFAFEDTKAPRVEPPFWRKGMLRLFVSHLAAHRAFAGELQQALLPYGISCFVAHEDIEPTQEWQTQIETALATCDALVALLHDDFHLSYWTDQEIGFAMGRGAAAFSVRFSQVPYGFIGRFQAFNGNGKTAGAIARELFDAYRKNKQTQHQMSRVLIGLFEESGSFADAKTNFRYLEDLEIWEPSFSVRIRAASKGNSQVSGSWGLPERVEALIEKWEKRGS
jgi:hypothetical protein